MYILIGILFAICIIFFVINFYRRKCIIRKICCMDFCEKYTLINDLAYPFGFSYLPSQDIMTSTIDAWQKNFGYCSLYDKSACHFNMVFDCEPVYFEYDNKTWLIEFWKGQYGINIGGEVGIYHADKIICPSLYGKTLFYGVSDEEMLPISMKLNFKGQPLFCVRESHWWLTGFRMGAYCEPEDLTMEASLSFPNEEMLQCFVKSMKRLGYSDCELCVSGMNVSFTFSLPHTYQPRMTYHLSSRFSQWKNRIFCRLFVWITKPFTQTMDRLLFLYYFLPASFRHLLRFKKNRKQKCKRKPGCKKHCCKRKPNCKKEPDCKKHCSKRKHRK